MSIKSLTSMSAASLAEFISQNLDNIDTYVKQLKQLPDDYLSSLFENMPYSTLARFKVKGFSDILSPEFLMKRMKAEEDEYREAFALRRDADRRLQFPHLMCLSVFDNKTDFVCRKENEFEQSIPKLFRKEWSLEKMLKKGGAEECVSSVVPSIEEFRNRFNMFTCGQLDAINWDNVLVAGGSVLACLMNHADLADDIPKLKLRRHFLEEYKSSDIDIFVYGLNEKEANQKIIEIYNAICDENPNEVLSVLTKHAVTFVSKHPFRHVQIVLRLYKSPAEILMGFDIDACSVGFDGTKVWALPRAQRALNLRWNLLDIDRRSLTYEVRLAKYGKRGFAVAMPGFKRDKVKKDLFGESLDSVSESDLTVSLKEMQGLKRLLALEYKAENDSNSNRFRWSEPTEEDEKKRETMIESESDYSAVFLPWHPNWDARRINLHLNRRVWSRHYGAGDFGALEIHSFNINELFDFVDKSETREQYLSGPLEWVTKNPGRQIIGSFHPLPPENFEDGVYEE